MNAIILSVGDELVLGQTVDTNSAWMSQQLAAAGCDIVAHATVPDAQPGIEAAILAAVSQCDVLLISGGIGPTADDLTRQSLAAVLSEPLESNTDWLEHLHAWFATMNRPMAAINAVQAMIPRGAKMIWNHAGTAAGIDVAYQSGDLKTNCRIFAMPGVPKEMMAMFTRDVLPFIAAGSGGAVILSRTLHTFGMGESTVGEKLGPLMDRRRNPGVGTTVSNNVVSLRLNARFPSKEEALQQLDQTTAACRDVLGDLIFGQNADTLPAVLAGLLTDAHVTVTTAESCTGGLLAKMLTDVPGSSTYFKQGWVTYSNDAKYDRLGINHEILNVHGAVSEPVVELMAKHARRLAKSTYALSISGIAGPGGGSPTKPVGTVCIGLATIDPADKNNSTVQTRTFVMPGDREMIRDRSAKMALTMLRFRLLNQPLPF